jgi:hypothetical protein
MKEKFLLCKRGNTYSTGRGEVARSIGFHKTKRVAKEVPGKAVPLVMLKSAATPSGTATETFYGFATPWDRC